MTDPLIERFRALGTATVSDALDKLRRSGSLLGLAPLADGQRMVGRAFTVRYVSAQVPAGTVGDFIDQVEPGQVVVLDNDARVDCTVWGDILTAVAHHRGIAGTVIEGVCRDTHRALSIGYPIYSRGRFMRTGKDRVEVAEEQGPVTIGGVTVRPGDILLGDSDGVVVIPQDCEAEVLEVAETIHAREESILAAALAGASIAEARARYGYHDLQRAEA
ncbi:RraA family protein [Microbacterium azadirachtae]|uniref:RraA family protein n=1 Tax=Microbacterium azadirachtae TaxID=582680 RepID=UPI0008864FE5|nr:RraA family protein [Microbacterium azadirachtae]SDM14709.1 Regulator of RNase E activity RraA [Microbacterium azadirachtae]SEG38496.1 Regulator of RNase E activity RraA [Microbacterium azadirachtae]SEG41349.1 Regulator of RNase E activity RraA [Microbacterium azadirachtae]